MFSPLGRMYGSLAVYKNVTSSLNQSQKDLDITKLACKDIIKVNFFCLDLSYCTLPRKSIFPVLNVVPSIRKTTW